MGRRASLDAPFAEELCVIWIINNNNHFWRSMSLFQPCSSLFGGQAGGSQGSEEAERSKHGTPWLRGGPGWTRLGSLHGPSECQRCLGGRIPPPPAVLFVRSVGGGGKKKEHGSVLPPKHCSSCSPPDGGSVVSLCLWKRTITQHPCALNLLP